MYVPIYLYSSGCCFRFTYLPTYTYLQVGEKEVVYLTNRRHIGTLLVIIKCSYMLLYCC